MRVMVPGRLLSVFVVVLAALAPARAALAEEAPLIVVVEMERPARGAAAPVDADAIRAQLAPALGVPPVAISDARAAAAWGMLSVLLSADGRRATLELRPNDAALSPGRATATAAGAGASWLADAVSGLIATVSGQAQQMEYVGIVTEVLDPWGFPLETRPDLGFVMPSEVIDPFTDLPLSPNVARIASIEVLDPWARPADLGRSLSAPAPGHSSRSFR